MADGIVDTCFGPIRGGLEDGVWRFLGVRYARPPVGDLRMRPPAPPAVVGEVVEATSFGSIAPQPPPAVGTSVPGDPGDWDEDCLFLNVWTPALDDTRRPVMVFVHGGGFVSGSSASQLYRGERLAKGEDVVVVTLNYRLGALGFLGHPGLRDPESGVSANWGLLDQVAALEWVKENISAFGGDPSNVTIFGESAGGISVCNLMAMPTAAGLFRRAIVQSGPAVAISPAAGARVAELIAAELGFEQVGWADFAGVPATELLAAQARIGARFDGALGLAFQPVIDGVSLPRHPADVIAGGEAAGIDLLIGTNRDEFKFFAVGVPGITELDEEGLHHRVDRGLRAAGLDDRVGTSEVVEAYRAARLASGSTVEPFELFSAMASDWVFRVPSIRLAEAHARSGGSTYCYLFEWESPFLGGALGSCHALELPFVFGTLGNRVIAPFSGDGDGAQALSAAIRHAWGSFARAGNPADAGDGGDGHGDRDSADGKLAIDLGPWPRYEPTERETMVLGPHAGVVSAPMEAERRFWEAHLGRYGVHGPVEGVDPGRATIDTAEGRLAEEQKASHSDAAAS